MPRGRKTENNLQFVGNSASKISTKSEKEVETYANIPVIFSTENKSEKINQNVTSNFEYEGPGKFKIGSKRKLSFKNPNWSSKFRTKEKTSRVAKNIKSLMQDPLDNLSFTIYQSIEAGPSCLPKKKYCDITGLEAKYSDPKTGLRYYNSEIFKIIQNLSEPIKNQYLAIRKALFVIK